MGLMHDNTLSCFECGHDTFRAEEQYKFHKTVRERFYLEDKEKPLPHLQKIIIYKCAHCGRVLNR